jgi:hypothetical protein
MGSARRGAEGRDDRPVAGVDPDNVPVIADEVDVARGVILTVLSVITHSD